MNGTINQSKIDEFNLLLQQLSFNYLIQQVIDNETRQVAQVVDALNTLIDPRFFKDEVAELIRVIETRGSANDISPTVKQRLADADLAQRLLSMYAEILGAPTMVSERMRWIDWDAVGPEDHITV